MTTMPAVALTAPSTKGRRPDVRLIETPRPTAPPLAGMLRLSVLAAGLCGTDATLARGDRAVGSLPWVLGHEAVGEVIATGLGTDGWTIGQRVVLEPNVVCGRCRSCLTGMTSACADRASSGVLTQPGFMTEVVDHPAAFCHAADPASRLEDLVAIEPLAVARAAVRRADPAPGDDVLVLGAGAQGLFAVLVLVARGLRPSVVDLDDARVALAERHGARAVAAGEDGPYDHVIDTTGAPAALAAAFPALRAGATITVVGESDALLGLSSQHLVQRQLRLRGSFIYDHPIDFAETLRDVQAGLLRPGELLAPPSALEHAPELLRGRGAPGKPWLLIA